MAQARSIEKYLEPRKVEPLSALGKIMQNIYAIGPLDLPGIDNHLGIPWGICSSFIVGICWHCKLVRGQCAGQRRLYVANLGQFW